MTIIERIKAADERDLKLALIFVSIQDEQIVDDALTAVED